MKTYSTYEAKARLSELLDRVEKGDVVTITRHGEPIAEVRPIEQPAAHSFSRRVDELRRRGVLSEPGRRLKALRWRAGKALYAAFSTHANEGGLRRHVVDRGDRVRGERIRTPRPVAPIV